MFSVLSRLLLLLAISLAVAPLLGSSDHPEGEMSGAQRKLARNMLHDVTNAITTYYYDPKMHGFDLAERVKEAERKIAEAKTLSDAFGVIAWTLEGLDDSHTVFIPPLRTYLVENGWRVGFVGDRCFILSVKVGSDASRKGVRPGDEVLAIERYRPTRAALPRLLYAFDVLAPRSAMNLVLAGPGSPPQELLLNAEVKAIGKDFDLARLYAVKNAVREFSAVSKVVELPGDVVLWKLRSFLLREEVLEEPLKVVRAHQSLVLDLRGNGGGSETVLLHLLGALFDHDVKVGDRITHNQRRSLKVKGTQHAFSGKLTVLVDSGSASAAEIAARVIQLEHRGTVMGDRSSGRVEEALFFPFRQGDSKVTIYAAEISISDLLMSDGHSLEHVGVVPDLLSLPTQDDLAHQRDPVLSQAARDLGAQLTPQEAAGLFPLLFEEWK